jgi:hypothetical protein
MKNDRVATVKGERTKLDDKQLLGVDWNSTTMLEEGRESDWAKRYVVRSRTASEQQDFCCVVQSLS